MNRKLGAIQRLFIVIAVLFSSLFVPTNTVKAAANLTITPITWNVIGLDSNNVSVGPNNFPVGVRVCNTGDEAADNVAVDFVWDTTDTYINLRSGSLTQITTGSIPSTSPDTCVDYYFEVEVTRNSSAYDHTADYHIEVDSDDTDLVETPSREIYVEHLISQSRNSTTNVTLDDNTVDPGGTMTLMVGQTYDIQLFGSTATNGYEQIESYINFPNTIFQINSITSTYTANGGTDSEALTKVYADGCNWENDPNSPNYRSCLSTGKYGGIITVDYNVTIIGGAGTSEVLNTLIYDFSGSSYHYNADFSSAPRYVNIVDADISKAFSPKTINPDGISTLTFNITNPGPDPITGVNFSDDFPSGLSVADTPNVSYSPDCTAGAFSPALTGSETTVSFSGGTVAGYGTCTILVDMTASTEATYANTSNNLIINTTSDTGNYAEDSLVVTSKPAAPDTCDPAARVTLATWDFTTDTSSTIPATADVSYADATYSATGTSTVNAGVWKGTGWVEETNPSSEPVILSTDAHFQFRVDTSNYGNVDIQFYANINANGNWTGTNNQLRVWQSADSAAFSIVGTDDIDLSTSSSLYNRVADVTGSGDTRFRVQGYYAKPRNTPDAEVWLDNVTVSGCPRPDLPELSKSFSDTSIPQGSLSTLTFELYNPNTSALTGVGFSDELPAGLLIANPNNLTISCPDINDLTNYAVIATAGTSLIELTGAPATSGATFAGGVTCTLAVDVLGDEAGQYLNISDSITSAETGPNTTSDGYGTDNLDVIAPPVIAKAFGANSILTNASTTLKFTIYNPNSFVTLSGVNFTDNLPSGLVVSNPNELTYTCNGTVTADVGTSIVSWAAGTLSANDSCEIQLKVTSPSTGLKENIVEVSSTNGGTGNTAEADLLVKDPVPLISLLKQVGPTVSGGWTSFLRIGTSANIYYRFVVENTGDEVLNSVNVTDLDLSLASCSWVDGDGNSLSAPFTLEIADSPTSDDHIAECILGPITTNSSAGSYSNTATASGIGSSTVTDTSTATYNNPELTIVKSAAEAYFETAGDVLNYSYEVTNSGYSALEGPVTIDDDLATDETCPAVSTAVQTVPAGPGDGDNWLDIGERITCTATYTTDATDVTAGEVTNIASASEDDIGSATDTVTVPILVAPTVTKTFTPDTILSGGISTLTITIENTNPIEITDVDFSDTFPAGLAVASTPTQLGKCQKSLRL